MKFNKKMMVASTTALTMFAAAGTTVEALDWTPRSVAEIAADIEKSGGIESYTIKYGDTLGSIALAADVDLYVLAQIKQFSNLDLVLPGTVLTLTYDESEELSKIEVAVPVNGDMSNSVVEVYEVVAPGELAEVSSTETSSVETVKLEAELSSEVTSIEPVTPVETFVAPTVEEVIPEVEATPAPVETTVAVVSELVPSEIPTAPTPTSEVAVEATPVVPAVVEVTPAVPEVPVATENSQEVTALEVVAPVEAVQVQAVVPAVPVVESQQTTLAPASQPVVEAAPAVAPANPVAESQQTTPASAPVKQVASAPVVDPMSNPENAGLQPHVAAYKEEVASIYGVDQFSLYRPGDSQDHGKGLAVDFMVPVGSALGDQIAQYAVDSMASKNISYIIWEQKFYSPGQSIYGPANTWNPMPDRGNITENHFDHVHVSFNAQ